MTSPQRYNWTKLDPRILDLRERELSFREIGAVLDINKDAAKRRWRFLTGLSAPERAAAWKPSSELLRMRQACADAFDVTDKDIAGRARFAHICQARQAACYVIRRVRPKLSYPCIAQIFGGRDHSTIIHACRTVEERIKRDPQLAGKVAALITLFGVRDDYRQRDAHIVQWREFHRLQLRNTALEAQLRRAARERAQATKRAEVAEDEFAAAIDPRRRHCGQCDRAVLPLEASRCGARLCGLRRPLGGAVGVRERVAA